MNSHRLGLVIFWRMLWIWIADCLSRCFARGRVFVEVGRIEIGVDLRLVQCIFLSVLRIRAGRLSRHLECLRAWRKCQLVALNFVRFLYQRWFKNFSQMMNLKIEIHLDVGNETFSWFHSLSELSVMVWAFTQMILKTSLFLMTWIYWCLKYYFYSNLDWLMSPCFKEYNLVYFLGVSF